MLPENDYKDIIEAQNGNKEKMTSLIKNNIGLVYNITKRFQGRGYDVEELNQVGVIGLIKSIKNFNINYEVKLSTYSVPYILGEIKKFIRDDGNIKISRSIKELAIKINYIKEEFIKKEGREIKVEEIANKLTIEKLISELDDRDKKIIILRYYHGNTQTEVSKLLGISQVQVSRIEKKLLNNMRKKLA